MWLARGAIDARDGRAGVQLPWRVRLVDAMLDCVARQGLAKTTLDDVARQAGCSRATLYRVFPGGKDALFAAAVDTEVARLFSSLAVAMGQAADLADALVVGISGAAECIEGHQALSYLLQHEPELVLERISFAGMDQILDGASSLLSPFLARWLDPGEASRIAEWATRIVVSYLVCPREDLHLSDPRDARRIVNTFVLPAVAACMAGGRQPGGVDGLQVLPESPAVVENQLSRATT